MGRIGKWQATVLVVALPMIGFIAMQSNALAHAELDSAVPAIGGTVATLPPSMTLTFTEEVKPGGITIEVIGPDGARIDTGDAQVDLSNANRNTVIVSLYAGGPGAYAVKWDSVSNLDGDEANGNYSFTVSDSGTEVIGDAAVSSSDASPTPDPNANGNPLGTASHFDTQGFFLSLGAGLLAVIAIVGVWLAVRPKNPKFGPRAKRD
jgi:copper resistance protein C